ncbi:MAG: hypothetical protein O7A04_11505, partial [Acidobacteria bacterium]|nr:hypothetical protein [Acidobacteriota bacterium]
MRQIFASNPIWLVLIVLVVLTLVGSGPCRIAEEDSADSSQLESSEAIADAEADTRAAELAAQEKAAQERAAELAAAEEQAAARAEALAAAERELAERQAAQLERERLLREQQAQDA